MMNKSVTKEEKFENVMVGGEPKTIIVKHPSPRVEAEANMHASKIFSSLTKDPQNGLLLRAKLDNFLKEQGLYTEKDINDIRLLTEKIEELESKLTAGGIKKSEGKSIAIDLRRARLALLILLAKRIEYDKNTIEYHAETGRSNYIIAKCLCDESGDPIFKSVEDYEFDETGLKEDLLEPIKRIGTLSSSYDPDYESKLIENKFLKKFGYCNNELELVNDKGELVDEFGRKIDKDGNLLNEDGTLVVKVAEVGEFLED
jgi:hypothetical protein